jgi:hypothetical protein
MTIVRVVLLMTLIALPLAAQEIDVQRPAGIPIPSGSQDKVGSKTGLGTMTLTYTIVNTDANDLTLSGASPVTPTSPNNLIFTLTQPGASVLGQNGSTTFQLDITPADDGAFALNLNIASDDADEGTYVIRIRGNTGTEEKEEEDCSTHEGTRPGILMLLAALGACGITLRFRGSRG